MSKNSTPNLDDQELDLFVCPDCRKRKMYRVKRTNLEKFVAFITFGKTADKKYFCSNCNRSVFSTKE